MLNNALSLRALRPNGGWILGLLLSFGALAGLRAQDAQPVKLYVREVPVTVLGKTVKMAAIEQADGTQGYSPTETGGFHVEVINKLPVPTSIHWHGLVLPNLSDGVPYVTQNPIPPGGSQRYDFPLKQSGSYWMHSHYGLQEQQLVTAPMIIQSPAQAKVADTQYTVMLGDFSFSSPDKILAGLRGGMGGMKSSGGMSGMSDMKGSGTMSGMDGMSGMDSMKPPAAPKKMGGMRMPEEEKQMIVQQWSGNRFVAADVKTNVPDIDVKYDALIANRRTLDNPDILPVTPGSKVLLRLIAGSSATNFFIDTASLEATIVAVDGENVKPLKGNFFQLAIAQRIDLLVTIPKAGGAFPILALGEGTTLRAGVVLATKGAEIPKLPPRGSELAGGMDNNQEVRLVARNPLPGRKVDRVLPSVLGGDMATYKWSINGAEYPNHNSLNVKEGERVEMDIVNETGMSHPMHLHGHVFEVSSIDGKNITGAVRDTILVPPKSTIKVIFDANNPGVWPYHCHILYHMATGMFTVLKYDGADTKYWRPDMTETEMENPLNL